MKCRACNTEVTKFFSLGEMPLVNSFLKKDELKSEERFDLSLGFCKKCYLVQLIKIVSPKKLFRNYIYLSSNSKMFLEHCEKTAKHLVKKLGLGKKSLVLEIASNDGSQLQAFKKIGVKVLGIDPAVNVVEIATRNNIPTIAEFFNYKLARTLKTKKKIQADLVFGANVLAHVPEITDFVKGVKVILKPRGTAVFEFPYLNGLLEKKFDIIYHEHVFYYSAMALKNLFGKAGLEIYDVEKTPMQGGSLRIYIARKGVFKTKKSVENLIKEETAAGLKNIDTYHKINTGIVSLKNEIISTLKDLRRKNKRVAAYSAPAKGNIMLNYFGIKENYLDFIVDKSKTKQGLYTPGTHLLVHPLEKIYEKKLHYLLILCWNISDEIVEMKELEKYRKNGGKFIVPLPELKII
ncbi:MAG TPA: class I SAM-dependent methyltransferase [Candidatus Paceibacterota bacterium]